ncbi:MAG: hypothetical protein JXK05_10020 [Campylobacterales bacterium]|nr:hypothetical protein [Campylobacterales bacterium]
MALPELPLPLSLPFEVPLLLHPVVAHFAIAIPVIVLLIELANLYFKRRVLSVTTTLLLSLAALFYLGLYVTGKADGSEAFIFLSEAGKEELGEHKTLGIYIIYFLMIVFGLRLLTLWVKAQAATTLYLVTLLLLIALNVKQGHDGGELIYEYGANVAPLSTCQDETETLREEIQTLKAELQTLREREQNGFDLNLTRAAEMIKQMLLPEEAPTPAQEQEQHESEAPDQDVVVIDAQPHEEDTSPELPSAEHNETLSF